MHIAHFEWVSLLLIQPFLGSFLCSEIHCCVSVLFRLLRFDILYWKRCNRFSSDMKWLFGFHTHPWNWRGFVTHADIIQQLWICCSEWVSDKIAKPIPLSRFVSHISELLVFDFEAAQAPASRIVWVMHALLVCYIRCKTWCACVFLVRVFAFADVTATATQHSDSTKKQKQQRRKIIINTCI